MTHAHTPLKPCPFCGCKEVKYWYEGSSDWVFECQECSKSSHYWVRCPMEDWDNGNGGEHGKAIRLWNTRATDPMRDELVAALEQYDIMYQQMKEAFIRGAAWHTIEAQRDNMDAAQRNAREVLSRAEGKDDAK